MSAHIELTHALKSRPQIWLITGVAGFIGSNLLQALLELDQQVVGLDNFSSGQRRNLNEVQASVAARQWQRFRFIEGDICDPATCMAACAGVHVVLHQAALGSVPRSLAIPLASHQSNVTGLVNMLWAAKQNGIRRLVYASSSSVYGDHPDLPKVEANIGNCLSPYAATKRMNEIYADVFGRCYGLECIGLRYFNVFGPRQDPDGPYAAVIPKWIAAMINHEPVVIHGDGETSRDFCYVANVIQANLLAVFAEKPDAINQVYNVAVGGRTTLKQLFEVIRKKLLPRFSRLADYEPQFRDFRPGDVQHSHADISKACRMLSYQPSHTVEQGLDEALNWYCEALSPNDAARRA